MCALRAGQRGRTRAAARPRREGRQEDPDLRRRALQLHQPATARPEAFLSANPHFCKSALARYTPARLHRPGRQARHRLPREDAGPAVLRRIGAADRGHAAGRMRRGRRRRAGRASHHGDEKADRFAVRTDKGDFEGGRAGAGDRRPVDPQDGRDRLRPRHGTPLRARDDARRGRRWCRSRAKVAGARRRGARRSWRAAARRPFARPCCSPIAACRGRRSCRSRPTGSRGRRSSSICCPTSMRRSS